MEKFPVSRKLAFATATLTAMAVSPAGLTQVLLEEVIVTAQKREQSLQDVPVAVTAFTGEMIQKTGVKDLFDLQVNAPSLIVGQTQTSTTTTFSIRGVFTSSQNFGLEPSVGLYVDGVYRARQSSMINNLVDIAAVEVLRGPQGTLFGRNTPAGAIQINSVAPDFEGTGFFEATAGNFNLFTVNGAKSFTLIDDVLAVRATGFGMLRDGFVDTIKQGDRDENALNDRERWGVRLQALYTPTDDLTMHVIVDRSEVDEICCAVGSFKNNFTPQNLPEGSDIELTGTDFDVDALGGTVLDRDDFFDLETASFRDPVSQNDDQGISLQVDWQTDLFLVTSISAYREFDSFDDAEVLFTDLAGAFRINEASQDQFTQELRVSNEYDRFNYVAGLYYYRQNLDNDRETIVGADLSDILRSLGTNDLAFIEGASGRDLNEQEHTSYAVFGQADFNITDSLVLTAGLRWTKEDKDLSNRFEDDAPPVLDPTLPNWGFFLFPPVAPRPDLDTEFDDTQVTGTIKLSWFMNQDIMFYTSYGTGYKAGGINADRIPEEVPVLFDPEESESYEIGMKAEFPEQRLRANIALHKTVTEDLQTVSFQGGAFVLANAGTADTKGVELDMSWVPTDSTTLTLAYAFNNGEYEDFEDGPCWTSTPWHTQQPDPADPNPGVAGPCDRSGGDLAGNPESVLVLSGNQGFRLTDNLTGFAYGEYIFTGDRMTDVNNDPAKRDGSYSLLNLRLGLVYAPWNANLTLWGRNVTDAEYVTTISDAVGQEGRLTAFHQEPTTWGLTLRKDF